MKKSERSFCGSASRSKVWGRKGPHDMSEPSRQTPALVLTIGHSTRSIEEFLELLETHGAGCLIDVRSMPRSRRNPQFNVDTLPEQLDELSIGYRHVPDLGGLRRPRPDSPNAGWRNLSFRGYADYMQTSEFQTAVEWLAELSHDTRLCLMCAEAVPWRCHRRMISDALTVRGIAVEHVMGASRRQTHDLTPWAEVVGEDGQLLYPSQSPTLEQAEVEDPPDPSL